MPHCFKFATASVWWCCSAADSGSACGNKPASMTRKTRANPSILDILRICDAHQHQTGHATPAGLLSLSANSRLALLLCFDRSILSVSSLRCASLRHSRRSSLRSSRACARAPFSLTQGGSILSVSPSAFKRTHARTRTHAHARARAHTHINNCNGNQKQKREIDAKFSLRSELYKFEADWREEGRDRRAATAASDVFRVPPFTNPKGALDERKAHFGIRA